MSDKTTNTAKDQKWTGIIRRSTTGAILIILSLIVVSLAHIPSVLPLVTAILSATAVYELIRAAHLTQERPFLLCTTAAAGIISLIPIPHYARAMNFIFPVALLIFLHIMRRNSRCILDTKPRTAAVCALVVLLFRAIPELDGPHLGLALLICYVTDAAAYLGGVSFGKHKLCKTISPNKTIEGSICSIFGSAAVVYLLGITIEANTPMLLSYGVVASVIGQYGDLSVSGVKRAYAVKDLGTILPGHGGILDRFDSHMLTIPFTLLFCQATGGLF